MSTIEATNYYADALKKGRRDYQNIVAKGLNPYLPALNEIIGNDRILMGSNIGLVRIPIELVIGTAEKSRSNSFASNFMPLMNTGTEFAQKWKSLCASQLSEGIRDAILVYEYMNRYYVREGNKRASVLKYLNAPEIDAIVTRIMPERGSSPEADLYYEQLDFIEKSGIRWFELKTPGGYSELSLLVGINPGVRWPEDIVNSFSDLWSRFQQIYHKNSNENHLSPADALLLLIRLFGYEQIRTDTNEALKQRITEVSPELMSPEKSDSIDLQLDPQEEKKHGMLGFIRSKPQCLNAAFIHDRGCDSRWVWQHEMGRQQVQSVLNDRVTTNAYFRTESESGDDLLTRAIEDGNTVLFTTSPVLITASLRTALEHPEITIFNCSLKSTYKSILTYYSRMYETKFISGAIAGCIAKTNDIGYIADYPIYGQVAGINAFALGVNMVNPNARVYLEWTCTQTLSEAEKKLTDRGITLISSLETVHMAADEDSIGLYLMKADNKRMRLASPVWQWGKYYELLLRRILDGTLAASNNSGEKALNYYWGMKAGVVSLDLSDSLPDGPRKLARLLQDSICAGTCDPFSGPVYPQGSKSGECKPINMSMDEIVQMNWLAENVVGGIPTFSQLNETGQQLAQMVGVASARPTIPEAKR